MAEKHSTSISLSRYWLSWLLNPLKPMKAFGLVAKSPNDFQPNMESKIYRCEFFQNYCFDFKVI